MSNEGLTDVMYHTLTSSNSTFCVSYTCQWVTGAKVDIVLVRSSAGDLAPVRVQPGMSSSW